MNKFNTFIIIILLFTIHSIGVLKAQETPKPGTEPDDSFKENSFGLGFGIPYGYAGISLDIKTFDKLIITGGWGKHLKGNFGYQIGIKYFLTQIRPPLSPRISVYYGNNTLVKEKGKLNNYHGITIGLGLQFMRGIGGGRGVAFDFDILYNLTTDFNDKDIKVQWRNSKNFSVSLGTRFMF